MNLSKKLLIFFLLTIIVILWAIYFLNKDFFQLQTFFSNLEIIQNFILQNFFISIFIFILSYSFLIMCNFPFASLLSMINGFLFGTWIGGTISILGGTIGAFGVFLIAKFFFLDFIKNKFLNKYSYIEYYFNKNDLELMMLIRIIPAIPFFLQNLILAGLGAHNKKFFYTTLIGLAPWSFIFGSIGQGLEEIFVNKTEISFSLIAQPEYLIPIGFVAFLIIMIIFFKKKFKN
ncbi:VTT domain-containing protein [Alphaproteobacteria bacterium]|nr:VTT domain-containing protein [Alphaproteobacteria bacterium]